MISLKATLCLRTFWTSLRPYLTLFWSDHSCLELLKISRRIKSSQQSPFLWRNMALSVLKWKCLGFLLGKPCSFLWEEGGSLWKSNFKITCETWLVWSKVRDAALNVASWFFIEAFQFFSELETEGKTGAETKLIDICCTPWHWYPWRGPQPPIEQPQEGVSWPLEDCFYWEAFGHRGGDFVVMLLSRCVILCQVLMSSVASGLSRTH